MALREGAPVAILAREAHLIALNQQGAKRQCFASGPIDPLATVDRLFLGIELALDFSVDGETLRHPGKCGADLFQHLHGHFGESAPRVIALDRLQPGPSAFQPIGLVDLIGIGGFEIVLEPLAPAFGNSLRFRSRQNLLRDQFFRIDLACRWVLGDRLVHQRLGKGRLVAFVVPETAVTEHVYDDILVEGLTKLNRDPRHMNHRFRIVAVHVENWRLHDLGNVRTIGPGAGVHRICGKSDLVVHHEMNGSANAVTLEFGEVQGLRHKPLAGESRIAMHQERHHLFSLSILALVLLCTHLADHHGIHRLKVRGICRQGEVN